MKSGAANAIAGDGSGWCDELAQNIQWHIELYAHDWPVTGNAY
jgi:hypothetical protein